MNYMPHQVCWLYDRSLILLHVVSDVVIWACYWIIPVIIIRIASDSKATRRSVGFPVVQRVWASFIVLCGCTHLMAAVVVWWPLYWLEGLSKAATATISILAVAYTLKSRRRLTGLLKALVQAEEALSKGGTPWTPPARR